MAIKVLVADDSPTIRRRATATLGEAGYDVTCVEDGQAAWSAISAGDGYAVLLCDILMPGMDGYELCRRVKADGMLSATPVLLLRGTFEPWDQAKAESVGADGFITKPFDAEALLSTLAEVVAESGATLGGDAPGPAAVSPAGLPASATASAGPIRAEPAWDPSPPLGASAPANDEMDQSIGRSGGPIVPDRDSVSMTSPPASQNESWSPRGDAPAASPLDASPLDIEREDAPPPELVSDDPFGALPAPAMADDAPFAFGVEAPEQAVAVPQTPRHEPASAPRRAPLAAPRPAATPAMPAGSIPGAAPAGDFDEAFLDRLAEKVVARLTTREIERIAWDVVPDVAEALIRKRLGEIEGRLAGE